MTAFTSLYPFLRVLLGDRQVRGCWNYDDATLASALKTIFALGRNPTPYTLDTGDLTTATGITPNLPLGDPLALILYDTCLLLVMPEDGAMSYRTRSFSANDKGDRKRDMLLRLEKYVWDIRNGDAVFTTYQSFVAFAGAFQKSDDEILPFGEFTGVNITSGVQQLSL